MTYCIGILVREGMVMMGDTRTNAGVDNISTYRKLRILETGDDRVMTVASAGSLSVTQSALSRVQLGIVMPDSDEREFVASAPTVFRAAQIVGQGLSEAKASIDLVVKDDSIRTDASLLFGGSIDSRRPRMFLIYGAGNFIECQPDTPFLQIGEHKYGKPVLDRMVNFETPMAEAIKIALISFSATMRSNLAVGLPIDIVTVRTGTSRVELSHRIDAEDHYYRDINDRWSNALRAAAAAIPLPSYASEPSRESLYD
ncbi:peptidase [Polymorphobacter glacialis]|uniref:Peptidase n=1 Tax=Sandarakinorhabdus glacialis TaxID=1614636 RepID=A0A917E3Q6_9SPHN|nr:peptidase [Polymorphobacter glacialis]GGE00096.1 peptidase [Polymorphobacter glacialis]